MTTPTLNVTTDGLLVIQWPDDGKPESFAISSDLFGRLIGECNLARLRLRALNELRSAMDRLIEPPTEPAPEPEPEPEQPTVLSELPG